MNDFQICRRERKFEPKVVRVVIDNRSGCARILLGFKNARIVGSGSMIPNVASDFQASSFGIGKTADPAEEIVTPRVLPFDVLGFKVSHLSMWLLSIDPILRFS